MNRSIASAVLILTLLLSGAGCDWYSRDEVALRALPYPHDAGAAIDDGSAPTCLASRGVRFAFDGENVRTVGQDAPCSLVDRGRQLWESLKFLYSRREWRGSSFFANRLFEPRITADGATVYTYKTYTGTISDPPRELRQEGARQVAAVVAYELAAKGGVMIVGGDPDRQWPFTAASLELFRGGVSALSRDRLLGYGFIRRYLDWSATRSDAGVTIDIRAVDDGVTESWVPTIEELDGITFYTPDPSRTRVRLGGEDLTEISINPRDRTHRASVTIHAPRPLLTPVDTQYHSPPPPDPGS